jgi:hypothetical protein
MSGLESRLTVPDRVLGRQCIAAESAAVPQGPYRDTSSGPLV